MSGAPGYLEMTGDPVTTDKGTIFDLEASRGELAGYGFEQQFDENPLALLARMGRTFTEDWAARFGGGEIVGADVARKEVSARGLDIKIPDGGMSRYELDMTQYLKQREVARNTAFARPRPTGGTLAAFGGGLAASLVDPLAVASNFIPVVGPVRYAKWLEQAGEGALARATVRAGAGTVEGVAGAALLEPIVLAGADKFQLDYTATDSFINVTFGGALGAGLHSLGGAVFDRAAPPSRLRSAAALAPEDVKRQAMQDAVAAMERGDDVDVGPIFAQHLGERYGVTDQEFLARAGGFDDDAMASAVSQRAGARGVSDSIPEVRADLKGVEVVSPSDVEPGAVQSFTTAKGSTYQVNEDGTTTRDKAFRPEHGAAEQGPQPRSQTTFYVTPEDAQKLGEFQTEGTKKSIEKHASGQWGVKYLDGKSAGKFERRTMVTPQSKPAVGLTPVEIWQDGSRVHFGNEITAVKTSAPMSPLGAAIMANARNLEQRGLADLIPQARADRTEPAFTRQFVDDATETVKAEKAKPKDRIEAAQADDADWREVVDEFRNEGHIGPEDEAALKTGDDLAAWAERRAKAFEAAAGCIEAT